MKTSYSFLIKHFCNDFDYTFHSVYSGRHQYGKKCVAISGDSRSGQILLELVKYSISYFEDIEKIEDFATFLENYAEDNLGMGRIIYFPN